MNYDQWRTTEPLAEELSIQLPAVVCAHCRYTGHQGSLATAGPCWGCWAVEYAIGRLPSGERT